MRIAVTSQNFRTITGHAGKARRFMILDAAGVKAPAVIGKLDLPRTMSMHEHPRGAPHPIDDVEVIVTAGCGAGFIAKMAERGIRVVTTAETDPIRAAGAVACGEPLPPGLPEAEHEHHGHQEEEHACGCSCED